MLEDVGGDEAQVSSGAGSRPGVDAPVADDEGGEGSRERTHGVKGRGLGLCWLEVGWTWG